MFDLPFPGRPPASQDSLRREGHPGGATQKCVFNSCPTSTSQIESAPNSHSNSCLIKPGGPQAAEESLLKYGCKRSRNRYVLPNDQIIPRYSEENAKYGLLSIGRLVDRWPPRNNVEGQVILRSSSVSCRRFGCKGSKSPCLTCSGNECKASAKRARAVRWAT
jgi:hypothetical protein